MSPKSEFERLEQFVSKLLNKYDQLREKNTELQTLLHQRDEEILELKAEINNADTERGDITSRVKDLIVQIEEWEEALEETEADESDDESDEEAEVEAEAEESLSDEEDDLDETEEDELVAEDAADEESDDESEEEDSDDAVEKEGGLQQNLFSVEPQV